LASAAALLHAQSSEVFPGKTWERWEKPELGSYSSPRLEALRGWVKTLDTSALLVVSHGRIVFEYGDLAHLSYLASVRKSVLAILYGKYVAEGRIQLDKTLKDLQVADEGGLLPREEEAAIEHLLTARSGVYHPASNAGDDTGSAPPRGSQQPGRYFLYNNWDFNAAGAVFEQLTGRDIYDALETDLAQPIGMEDFDRSRQRKSGDPKRSKHLAYHMWLSTRDMARVGLLMARGGNWNGTRVAPADWVRRISSLVTPFHEMNPPYQRSLSTTGRWGYGYLWWVWDAPNSWPGPYTGAYTARGAGGQFITVFPNVDVVVAHKTDTSELSPHGPAERRRSVTGSQYEAILSMLIASYCGSNCP
jgi:CubicO group peptidase (beta-lactamase class C family)